jgi:hypothetical protein
VAFAQCCVCVLHLRRNDGHVNFLRQIPVVAATICRSIYTTVVGFHSGELNPSHLALDGASLVVSQELGSAQVTPGATFSKPLSHTETICLGQVWVGTGLLIDHASDLPIGRQP